LAAEGVLTSHDGGLTWHISNQQPTARRLTLLDFPVATVGFAITAAGQLLRVTEDAAELAQPEKTGLDTVTGVSFVDPQHGWVVGQGGGFHDRGWGSHMAC
jgi:photosystem II stability/assembly factor-like uncharacterized protein